MTTIVEIECSGATASLTQLAHVIASTAVDRRIGQLVDVSNIILAAVLAPDIFLG